MIFDFFSEKDATVSFISGKDDDDDDIDEKDVEESHDRAYGNADSSSMGYARRALSI